MDNLKIASTGFPETTKMWTFTQDILIELSRVLVKLAGENIIVSGLDNDNGFINDGIIIYNDEPLIFVGSNYNAQVSIIETVDNVSYNTDINDDSVLDVLPAYVTRYAICGVGLPNTASTFDFSELKRIKSIYELSDLEPATQQEVNDNEATKFVTGETLNGRQATSSRKGVSALASSAEIIQGTNPTKTITPESLKNAGIVPFKITRGTIITSNRHQGQFENDYTKNYGYVYPPVGYTMFDLRGFIPSLAVVYFNGDMNGDDTLWCNYEYQSNRVVVTCNNSENRANSKINYLAIWHK